MTDKATRLLLGAAGIGAAAYGIGLLVSFSAYAFADALLWLAGGVLLHDAILAPLTVGVAAVALRVLPRRVRAPLTAGLVILGTVTLTAIPVLLSRGARPDNPTLLDRNYGLGWLVLAAVVAGGVVLAIALQRRDARAGTRSSSQESGGGN